MNEWLKLSTMNRLQSQVAALLICPNCHTKTLRVRHEAADMSFAQCETCKRVYVNHAQCGGES